MAGHIDSVISKTLIEQGIVDKETLDPLVLKAAETSGGLASLLVKRGMVAEDVILKILSEKFNLPMVDLTKIQPQKTALDKAPLKFAEYYHFAPIQLEGRKLTVAVAAPFDIRTQDEIRVHLGVEIQMALSKESDVAEAIKNWYGLGAGTIGKILETAEGKTESAASEAQEEKVEDIEKLAEDASVIKLVNQILLDAYKKRATDIHIEPYRGKIKIRYRIDGILYNTNIPPEIKKFIHPIVSRIKIMSNLNIIERRLPQDGRAIVKISDETLDLRISSIPTNYGESIVIRLLPMNRLISLEKLGLEKSENEIFNTLIAKPHGIVLITGPTGSGKSTTLYACLSGINTDERKIITIEDPVEYEMEGVTQIQVSPQVGLDFAKGLRSVLRHDPDVVMIGEIRDLETAEIAARVALTGHLVFSTLHTNDAASGVTRLVDIGVEPYLVASSVEAFIAQRLVRTICKDCRQEDKSQPEAFKKQIAKEMGLKSSNDVKLYKGKGCDKCNGTGYWGRVAIFEVLLMNESLRELVIKRAPAGAIKKMAVKSGMRTLRQSGWQKAMAGLTTPEEILEVSPEEDTDNAEIETPPVEAAPETKKNSLVERRQFVRLNAKVKIHYHIVKIPDDLERLHITTAQLSLTKNVSAGGLVFSADEMIPVASILELKIELPGRKEMIECLSRVVRVEEIETEKKFDIAVCFLDLSGSDRALLEKFVQERLN